MNNPNNIAVLVSLRNGAISTFLLVWCYLTIVAHGWLAGLYSMFLLSALFSLVFRPEHSTEVTHDLSKDFSLAVYPREGDVFCHLRSQRRLLRKRVQQGDFLILPLRGSSARYQVLRVERLSGKVWEADIIRVEAEHG